MGQQGRTHGPYSVNPAAAGSTGSASSSMDSSTAPDIEKKEAFSHWVYVCRKRLEVCGLGPLV